MKNKFLALAIAVIIIIIVFVIKLNAWYSKNNLKFISEDMKEQIIEWLNIEKEYSNSLELISANQVSAGLSSHYKYCELIFKISKEEYENNKLNYTQDFDSPEMTRKGKKEYDNDSYMCCIRYQIVLNDDEYYILSDIICKTNVYIKIINFITFFVIILIIAFASYLIIINRGEK